MLTCHKKKVSRGAADGHGAVRACSRQGEAGRLPWRAAARARALGLAGALAILLEQIDAVVVTSEQLEAAHGVPVLGSVPHIS